MKIKTVGRNDSCPCGSGKKYKKCCEKTNVISLEHIVEQELEEIQKNIITYALHNYEDVIDSFIEEQADELFIPEEAEGMFHFFSTVFVTGKLKLPNGRSILQEYIEFTAKDITRKRTKDIVQAWSKMEPRPCVTIVVNKESNNKLLVKELFTEEQITIHVPENQNMPEAGTIMIGIILFSDTSNRFFATHFDLPPEKTKKLSKQIKDSQATSGLEYKQFYTKNFIKIISMFINSDIEVSSSEIQWNSPSHLEVANMLETELPNFYEDELIVQLGLILWSKYCEKKNPRIQKPILYVAAMIYLLDNVLPGGKKLTQSELTAHFSLSPSSISPKFKDIEYHLMDELTDLAMSFYAEDLHEVKDIPSFHPFSMEKELANITKILQAQDFDSLEEANLFINNMLNEGTTPTPLNESNKDKAQDLMYKAFEEEDWGNAFQMVKEALRLYPNLPDAYSFLAEYEDDPLELLLKAVEVGEKDLGKEYFLENKGHFWGLIETRPYMRAKLNLANFYMEEGMIKEALAHYEQLLELNPNDNQGVRDLLFIAYIEKGAVTKAEKLIKKFNDFETTTSAYNKLLLELVKNGATLKAKQLLKNAKEQNSHVVEYLLKPDKIPLFRPDAYSIGGIEEAILYADDHVDIWEKNKKAIQWLRKNQ